jgi:hypothetical protein
MWVGDRVPVDCPMCESSAVPVRMVVVQPVQSLATLRCAQGHYWTFKLDVDWIQDHDVRPPDDPASRYRATAHRGTTEIGPWMVNEIVADLRAAERLVDRWRTEDPDCWCAIAHDGTIYITVIPAREMAARKAAAGR